MKIFCHFSQLNNIGNFIPQYTFLSLLPDTPILSSSDSQLYCTLSDKTAVYGGSIDVLTREENVHWSFVQDDATDDSPGVQFILTAGTYTLKIANRDDGTMPDALMVIKVEN